MSNYKILKDVDGLKFKKGDVVTPLQLREAGRNNLTELLRNRAIGHNTGEPTVPRKEDRPPNPNSRDPEVVAVAAIVDAEQPVTDDAKAKAKERKVTGAPTPADEAKDKK